MKRFIFTKNENLDVEVEETYIEFDAENEYEKNKKELKNLENKKAYYEEKYQRNKELPEKERLDYIKTLWGIDVIKRSMVVYEEIIKQKGV